MVGAKSFCKNSQFQLENSFVCWMPRLERCEANLTSKFCRPWCIIRKSVNSGPCCWVVNQDLTLPCSCWNQSDYTHDNTMLLRNLGIQRFWELFLVLDILKDKNNSLAFINRNSFSGRTSNLLIESFLSYKKIAISSGVVEFSRVLAFQQKLFCCLKVGVLHWAHVFMMTNFPLLSKPYLI